MKTNVYYGMDFSDGLRHWKYKSKYKGSNGKWVYVYDDHSSSQSGGHTYEDVKKDVYENGKKYDEIKTSYKTNTNHLFDRNLTMENSITMNNKTTNYKTTMIEYGKLHVARMNTERRLSSLSSKVVSAGKNLLDKLLKKH